MSLSTNDTLSAVSELNLLDHMHAKRPRAAVCVSIVALRRCGLPRLCR